MCDWCGKPVPKIWHRVSVVVWLYDGGVAEDESQCTGSRTAGYNVCSECIKLFEGGVENRRSHSS